MHLDLTSARTRGRITAAVVVAGSVVAIVLLSLRYPNLPSMIPTDDVREVHADFDTFWHSAVALVHGGDVYATSAKLTNLNPPLVTVLLAPFAALDALTAYRVWVVLALIMVLGSVVAVARELRLTPPVTVLALLAVLASSQLHGTLVLGQIYPLLLVGLVAAWLAERRGHPVLAAVLAGVTVACKPSLAPVLLLPAVQRRWLPLRAGVAAAAAATIVGIAVCGPASGLEWLRIAVDAPVPDSVDNASWPGLAVRFGLQPTIGTVAGLVVLAGTLAAAGLHRERWRPTGTAGWAVLAAGLLASPIAWHNYLMLLWPGVLVLITVGRGAAATALLAVSAIPVSWNAVDALKSATGGSLYCAILFAYWLVLVRAAPVSGLSSGRVPAEAGSADPVPA